MKVKKTTKILRSKILRKIRILLYLIIRYHIWYKPKQYFARKYHHIKWIILIYKLKKSIRKIMAGMMKSLIPIVIEAAKSMQQFSTTLKDYHDRTTNKM